MISTVPMRHRLRGLGDHLRVGPQYMPQATQAGTPIIQRGPHGKRLAPFPPPAGTQRWWSERTPAVQWTPQQSVVALMGMGFYPGNSPFHGMGDYGSSMSYDAQFATIQQFADDGNVSQAQRALSQISTYFNNERGTIVANDPTGTNESYLDARIQALQGYIQAKTPGAADRAAAWNTQVTALQQSNQNYNATQGAANTAYEVCMANLRQQHGAAYAELYGPDACAFQTGGGSYEATGAGAFAKKVGDQATALLTNPITLAVGAAAVLVYAFGRGGGRLLNPPKRRRRRKSRRSRRGRRS